MFQADYPNWKENQDHARKQKIPRKKTRGRRSSRSGSSAPLLHLQARHSQNIRDEPSNFSGEQVITYLGIKIDKGLIWKHYIDWT